MDRNSYLLIFILMVVRRDALGSGQRYHNAIFFSCLAGHFLVVAISAKHGMVLIHGILSHHITVQSDPDQCWKKHVFIALPIMHIVSRHEKTRKSRPFTPIECK